MGKKQTKKQTLNIPLSMVKLLIYSLHFGWCISTPSHYKDTGVLPNSVAEEEKTAKRFHHEANVNFKTVAV